MRASSNCFVNTINQANKEITRDWSTFDVCLGCSCSPSPVFFDDMLAVIDMRQSCFVVGERKKREKVLRFPGNTSDGVNDANQKLSIKSPYRLSCLDTINFVYWINYPMTHYRLLELLVWWAFCAIIFYLYRNFPNDLARPLRLHSNGLCPSSLQFTVAMTLDVFCDENSWAVLCDISTVIDKRPARR